MGSLGVAAAGGSFNGALARATVAAEGARQIGYPAPTAWANHDGARPPRALLNVGHPHRRDRLAHEDARIKKPGGGDPIVIIMPRAIRAVKSSYIKAGPAAGR